MVRECERRSSSGLLRQWRGDASILPAGVVLGPLLLKMYDFESRCAKL